MAILTKEKKEKYLASGGGICPFCGDADISGGSVEIESAQAWQNVSCGACAERWRDVYKLAFVETDEELEAQRTFRNHYRCPDDGTEDSGLTYQWKARRRFPRRRLTPPPPTLSDMK